jgi:hypothetical protein
MTDELLRRLSREYGYVKMAMITDTVGTFYEVTCYEHALATERLEELRTGKHVVDYHSSQVSLDDALQQAVAACGGTT